MDDGERQRSALAGTSPPGSFGELWRVALPLIFSSGSVSLTHVVDRVFLTWYSTAALAAALPAGILHWTVMSVIVGTATYVNTFVAQYDGAGRRERASASVWQGVYLSLGAGLTLIVVVPLAPQLFALIGHEPQVRELEIQYFSILCFGAVPMTMSAALSCFYSGRGETVVVMAVHLVVAAVNVGLDYCLIFGNGPFPAMGVRGAALATVAAHASGVGLFAILLLRRRERRQFGFWKQYRFDRELFGRLMRYGLPTGFHYLADISAFAMFVFLVGMIGQGELAATNVAFNVNTLAFVPMLGGGTAVMTLVGKRIGEGRPELAVRTTWLAFGLTAVYMIFFAAVYLFLPGLILLPYSVYAETAEFAAVRGQVVVLLRFVAAFSFFDGMAIVFGSAVRGAGDTRFPMILSLMAGWLLMVLPTWIAWHWYGGSLIVSWWACTAFITALGIGLFIRFQGGLWKSMRVIEHVGPDERDQSSGPQRPELQQRSTSEALTSEAADASAAAPRNDEDDPATPTAAAGTPG